MTRTRHGPLHTGEKVQCTDRRGRMVTVLLQAGAVTQTARGLIRHDDLIGACEGTVARTAPAGKRSDGRAGGGWPFVVMRPRLEDYVLSMPRGAQIMYPKDIAQVLSAGDIRSGMRVLESGAGSGALSLHLLDALGASGRLTTVEVRGDFAHIAEGNVIVYFGLKPAWWNLIVGDFDATAAALPSGGFDRVVLDMLDPWNRLAGVARVIVPGGVLTAYVTTTTQMSRTAEALRSSERWSEPEIIEILERHWKAEGLAVRPEHQMVGHTGFIIVSRAMAPGFSPLRRCGRAAKDTYADVDGTPPRGGEPGLDALELRHPSDHKLRKVTRELDGQVAAAEAYEEGAPTDGGTADPHFGRETTGRI